MTELDRYLRPRPALAVRVWLLPAVLITASCVLTLACVAESDKLADLTASNEGLLALRVVKVVEKPKPADLEQERLWTELRQERDFPWKRVFDSVERADRENIELLEFKPDKGGRRILLRGQARDAEALTAYLEALASDAGLDKVYLVHRQNAEREKIQTITFEIKASLRQ